MKAASFFSILLSVSILSSTVCEPNDATRIPILKCCPRDQELIVSVENGVSKVGADCKKSTTPWQPRIYSPTRKMQYFEPLDEWNVLEGRRPECRNDSVLTRIPSRAAVPFIFLEDGYAIVDGNIEEPIAPNDYCADANALFVCVKKTPEGNHAAATMRPKIRRCCGKSAVFHEGMRSCDFLEEAEDKTPLLGDSAPMVDFISGFPACPRGDNYTILADVKDAVLQPDGSMKVDGVILPSGQFCVERIKELNQPVKVFACSEHAPQRTLTASTYGNESWYIIREFKNLPTFYLEPLGQLRLYTKQWKIVSYLPLEDLVQQETRIEDGIINVKQLGGIGLHNRTIYLLERYLQRARKSRERLFSYVGYKFPWLKRTSRGLIEFVGHYSKILFGTMSKADAEYYNHEIDLVYKNEKLNAELLKDQTQILKIVLQQTDKLLEDYKVKLDTLNRNIHKIESGKDTNLIDEKIFEFSMILELEILSYQQNLDIIYQAILDGKRGSVSPNIIDPEVFFETIQKIRREEGSNQLPEISIEQHYYEYLQICDIEISMIDGKLVFVVKVPIFNSDVYVQYKVHSIPSFLEDDKIVHLKSPYDYVIANIERTQMSPSSSSFLNSCKYLDNIHYCKRLEPRYKITSEKSCLGRLLKANVHDAKVCTALVGVMQHSVYLPLQTGTDWIIVPHSSEEIQILCDQISVVKVLTKPSIIHLEPNCVASTDFVILEPVDTRNQVIQELQFDLLNYNFSLLDDSYRQTLQKIKLEELDIPKIEKLNSLTLDVYLEDLINEAEEMSDRKRTEYIDEVTRFETFLAYGLLSLLALYLSYKFRLVHLFRWSLSKLTQYCSRNRYNNKHDNRDQIIRTTTETTTEQVPMMQVPHVQATDIRLTLYPVGFIISAVFLAATLVAGWLLPASHHVLHWRCQTHHVACLMLGDLLMAIIQLAGDSLHGGSCKALAIMAHFFFLAAFFWLNTMCFNIWWTFRDLRPASLEKGQETLRLRVYSCYAWGGPLLVAGLAALLDHLSPQSQYTYLRPRFGEKQCWFYGDMEILAYFFGPIGVLLAVNLLFFAATARELTCGLWKGEFVKSTTERAALGRVCMKLVIVMGITWVADVVSWAVGGPQYIWYFTDLINAFQGVLIFAVVGCQPQVRAALKRLCNRNPRTNAGRQGNGLSTTSHGMPSMGDSVTQNPSTKTAPLETIC
ncbi:hypothetical protein KPH14_010005 [Odynerus spinipes]|uniref:G-protein coupled receptors family 2 profile 2 domain-containing protein n=1 Tax=Odynerus spinipes TaxID=1348599 RepID=A0AAD9RTV3_9HYME|nr:hypothetical protein KPH14_010005 [Odynerus spinipes]